MTIDNDLPVIRHTRKRAARFFDFSPLDWWWTVIAGVISLGVSAYAGQAGFFPLAFGICAAVWWWTMSVPKAQDPNEKKRRSRYFNDRRYTRPIKALVRFYIRHVKRGILWKAPDWSPSKRSKSSKPPRKRATASESAKPGWTIGDLSVVKPFPIEVVGVQLDEETNIGLMYNQAKQTYSIGFKGDGSDFVSLSRAEQYFKLMQLSSIITKAAAVAGFGGCGIGMGVRNRPQDQWLIPEMMLEIGHIDAILPEAFVTKKPESEYTEKDYRDMALHKLQEAYAQVAVRSYDVDMLIVITMKQKLNVKVKKNGEKFIDERDLKQLPLMRVRNAILPILEKQIGGVQTLDLEGAERNIRKARDTATLYEYHQQAHETRMDLMMQEMELGEDQLPVPDTVYDRYLPTKVMQVGNDFTNIDGTYAGVLDMTTFPADEVYAHDGTFLYDSISRWSSMSVVGKAAGNNLAYNVQNTGAGLATDVSEQLGRLKSGPRSERKEAERYEQLVEMDKEGVNVDYVIRFATLANSLDDLEDDLQLDFDRFVQQQMGPQRITGEEAQLNAFLTTVTLIDCE